MDVSIEISNITVIIDHSTILSEISAAIPTGKITGLLGPSGAGKTTLMRAIVGLQRLSTGTITVLGHHPGEEVLREQIGYVTQSPSVYNDLTVAENLHYFASIAGIDKNRVREVLEEVELTALSHRLASTLSGGQRARLSLAVALLGRPKVLVLDEPTVGLDPVLRERLWSHFHELAKSGVTLLVSSHVMDEAKRADLLLFIRDGKLLSSDTPQKIMQDTKSQDLEQAFLQLAQKA